MRRTSRVAVVILAVAGTAASLYGLSRVFAPPRSTGLGGTGVTPTPPAAIGCDQTKLTADLNADGSLDEITVYATESCDGKATAPDAYEIRVDMGAGFEGVPTFTHSLPECGPEWSCRLFSATDVNADGRSEVAIQTGAGASTLIFSLYRFDETGLQRLIVASPGDPWNEEFGLRPGADSFVWYGSVTHMHWMACDEDPEHRLAVMTALRRGDDSSLYRVHGTLLRLDGSTLVPEFSWDESVAERDLAISEDFCAAPLGSELEG